MNEGMRCVLAAPCGGSYVQDAVSSVCPPAGISSCTLSAWLTCRLASSEQQRMFLEREHSLHHSHEMAEKVRSHTAA